jgi:asparagine N-glycosylation enzyme membrane subunit Stt3
VSFDDDDGLGKAEIAAALEQTPRGAFALAGLTVGLLMAAWVAIYVFVFLPRGAVG